MRNIPAQFGRVRPTKFRTVGSINAQAPLLPGEGVKLTFTSAALGFQQLFYGGGVIPRFLSVKTTADCHIVFGPTGMAAAANTDALQQPGDSYQDWKTQIGDLGVDVKGDTAGGDLYIILSSE